MGMATFLGVLCVLLLMNGAPEGRSQSLHHYGLAALLVIGSFMAWALDRGLL
jgi:hypothetical protein